MKMSDGYSLISEYFDDIFELVKTRTELFIARKESSITESIIHEVQRINDHILHRNEITVQEGGYIPLEHICGVFGLSPFERHCLMLAIIGEIDASLISSLSELLPQPYGAPGLELAIRLFADDFGEYIQILSQVAARGKTWALLFEEQGLPPTAGNLLKPLKLNKRIIDFILNPSTDMAIPHILFLPKDNLDECIADNELYWALAYYAENINKKTIIIIEGDKGSGRKYHIKRFSVHSGVPVLFVNGEYLLNAADSADMVKTLCIEAAIQQAVLCLCDIALGDEADSDGAVKKYKDILAKIMDCCNMVFITSTELQQNQIKLEGIKYVKCRTSQNDSTKRIQAWNKMTENYELSENVDFSLLANKYAFSFGLIHDAALRAAEISKLSNTSKIDKSHIDKACKEQIEHNLGKRAVAVNAKYKWDELILPDAQKQTLRNACNQLKYKDTVYEQWNFRRKMAYGTGLSMLFSGPPGTGKTMAAQVIANDVNLDIYKVDLSSLMSKYIGETEKNLSIVFDEVKKSHSILFFDEADSVFGKRGEQKDSNDRFANIQTSYLLQRFEDYDGIVILATNFVQNFDDAFLRRIKFKIDFPFPDASYRKKIWESLMIKEAPFEDLDLDFLSEQFALSGSSIKNIIINGAFLAASENSPISMKQIVTAIKIEYNKTNKILLKEELREYADLF